MRKYTCSADVITGSFPTECSSWGPATLQEMCIAYVKASCGSTDHWASLCCITKCSLSLYGKAFTNHLSNQHRVLLNAVTKTEVAMS